MIREKHYKLGKRFSIRVDKRGGTYEYYVYKNGYPYGPYIASGSASSLPAAKKQAKSDTVFALKKMRQYGETHLLRKLR